MSLGSYITNIPNPSRARLDSWVRKAAEGLPDGAVVLDAGAGAGPYRSLFADGVTYESADIAQIAKRYTDLTYVCDLTAIPVEERRFDRVICNQVLEHVAAPAAVLAELHRVLKPGGELWVSAPLFYEEHEKPYDFYRYTQFGWRHLAASAGFVVRDLEWVEGYYGTFSYQLAMAARHLPKRDFGVRVVAGLAAHYFARRELAVKVVDRGMPKNYACVLVKEQ
ncbi:MAG: class I SAM-dependent methyltransferase [Acidimicrobiales bacterium]